MLDKTEDRYVKLTKNFYKTQLNELPPTLKRIEKALLECAHEYRPSYFRVLKNAIAYSQAKSGYIVEAKKIKKIQNPTTLKGVNSQQIKPKIKRVKYASITDIKKLSKAVKESGDVELKSALFLAFNLGCRPAEMIDIRQLNSRTILIKGAKKTEVGNRWLDRKVILSKELCQKIISASKVLEVAEMKNSGIQDRIRSRLNNITKNLWPRRKNRINLYTFRHQMGSNLKASNLSRVAVAYLMGHQSTASADVYGDKRKSTGKVKLKPAESSLMLNSIIRTKHEKPYSQQIKHSKENNTSKPTLLIKP